MEREPKMMEMDGRDPPPPLAPCRPLSVKRLAVANWSVSDRSIFLVISPSHDGCILTPRRKRIPQEVQRREGMVTSQTMDGLPPRMSTFCVG